jgi:hypothetical protein
MSNTDKFLDIGKTALFLSIKDCQPKVGENVLFIFSENSPIKPKIGRWTGCIEQNNTLLMECGNSNDKNNLHPCSHWFPIPDFLKNI